MQHNECCRHFVAQAILAIQCSNFKPKLQSTHHGEKARPNANESHGSANERQGESFANECNDEANESQGERFANEGNDEANEGKGEWFANEGSGAEANEGEVSSVPDSGARGGDSLEGVEFWLRDQRLSIRSGGHLA